MQKYVEVSVQDVALSGTSTGDQSGNNKVEDTGAFASGVAVGDILHDTSDDRMYTVAAVDDANLLSLTPIGATQGDGVGTGKSFIIYSATASSKQLVASDGVVVVENASADPINSEVNIQYCGKDGIQVKLLHAAVAAGNEEVRDGFEDAVEASLIQPWPIVNYKSWLPSSLILNISKV